MSLTGFVSLDTSLNIWSFIYSAVIEHSKLDPLYSKCGPWTGSIGITSKNVRLSRLTPDLLELEIAFEIDPR